MNVSIDDAMNRIFSLQSETTGDGLIVPPLGPRSLGSGDARWDGEVDALHDVDRTIDTYRSKDVADKVNELMIAIAASADDPRIPFRDDSRAVTSRWITDTLKPAYQSTRVADKKPWPEFLAALMHPANLSDADCGVLSTLFGVHVGLINPDGVLIMPSALRDLDLTTPVIDAMHGGAATTVGELVCIAWENLAPSAPGSAALKLKDLRVQIKALGMSDDGSPKSVLASKISSRLTALSAFEGHRPTS